MTKRDYQMKMETVKKAMKGAAVVLMGSFTLAATATTANADNTSAQPQMVRNIPASPISETEINVEPTTTEPIKNVPASPVSETEINVQPASASTNVQSDGANQSTSTVNQNGASQVNSNKVATPVNGNQQASVQTNFKVATGENNTNNSADTKDVVSVAQPMANKAAANSAVELNVQPVAFNQAQGQQARRNDNAKASTNHDAATKAQPVAAMSFGLLGLAGLGMVLAKAKKEF